MRSSSGPARPGRASKQVARGLSARGRDWAWHGSRPGKPRQGLCPPAAARRPGADISGARPLKRPAAILVTGSAPGSAAARPGFHLGCRGPAGAGAGSGGAAAAARRVLARAAGGRAAPAPGGHGGPSPAALLRTGLGCCCPATLGRERGFGVRWWASSGGRLLQTFPVFCPSAFGRARLHFPSPHSFTGVKLRAAGNVQGKTWAPVVNKQSFTYFVLI